MGRKMKYLGVTLIIFFLVGYGVGEYTLEDTPQNNEKKAYQIIEEGLERVNR